MLDGGEKIDENFLFFDFSLTQKPRIILGLSPKRRMVSSFAHAKEERKPPKHYAPKKNFGPFFSLISHGEKLSIVGTQNYGLFMIVTQTK